MKKNYIYLILLVIVTVVLTLFLADLYKKEKNNVSYIYDKLPSISGNEFLGYMLENSDAIIYFGDKTNNKLNKVEKKLINQLEKNNLMKNAIYIEKEEITSNLKEQLKDNYAYDIPTSLPILIIISDNELIQSIEINQNVDLNSIIDYEVLE